MSSRFLNLSPCQILNMGQRETPYLEGGTGS
jgi:hypothetical protein